MTRHFSAHEVLDIAEAVLFAQLLTYGLLFTLTRLDGIPRSVPLYHGLLRAAGLIFVRIVTRVGSNERRASDYQLRRERIIVIGANRMAASFISMLCAAPSEWSRCSMKNRARSAFIGGCRFSELRRTRCDRRI